MKHFALIALVSLAACSQQPRVACMSPRERGTIEDVRRVSAKDTCHETMCRNLVQPDEDTLIVSFQMPDRTKRVCKGRWYPEAETLKVGGTFTVTRLERGSL